MIAFHFSETLPTEVRARRPRPKRPNELQLTVLSCSSGIQMYPEAAHARAKFKRELNTFTEGRVGWMNLARKLRGG
jgi:hypothetical protein